MNFYFSAIFLYFTWDRKFHAISISCQFTGIMVYLSNNWKRYSTLLGLELTDWCGKM